MRSDRSTQITPFSNNPATITPQSRHPSVLRSPFTESANRHQFLEKASYWAAIFRQSYLSHTKLRPSFPRAERNSGFSRSIDDLFGQRLRVFFRDDQTGFPINNDIANSRKVRSNDRAFTAQCLHQHQPKPFLVTVSRHHGRERPQPRRPGSRAGISAFGTAPRKRTCGPGSKRFAKLPADRFLSGPLPTMVRVTSGCFSRTSRQRSDKVFEAFFFDQSPHEQQRLLRAASSAVG